MRHTWSLAAATMLSVAAVPAATQTLYRCTLPDGRTVYQDSKCDDNARAKVVPAPSSPAAAASTRSSSQSCTVDYMPPLELDPRTGMETHARRKARLEIETVVEVVTQYQDCSATAPGFSDRYRGAYEQFRVKYRDAVARFDANPAARRAADCRLRAEADRARKFDKPQSSAEKTGICMQMIGPLIEKLNREGLPT